MKIVISGYYGHGNFGDEAILRVITSELKKSFKNPEITVLSKIPDLRAIFNCDLFVSGGGSLLQDVTSVRSLVYYLGLLYLAIVLKKKTMIYSQGIGPVNSRFGRFLLANILPNVDLITVRDKESAEYLKSLQINSTITADPVWMLDYNPIQRSKSKINIGIQLRKWPELSTKKMQTLAKAVKSAFKGQDIVLNLISLQDRSDIEVLNEFKEMVDGFEVTLLTGLTLEQAVDYLSSMDCLIAMRYHACLVAAKYSVPFLAIAYDPKLKSLAKEANAPYVAVKDMNFSMLANAIKFLISEQNNVKATLTELSFKKAEQALMSPLLTRFFKSDSKSYHRKPGHEQVNSK